VPYAVARRRFTIRLKRLKLKALDFGGPERLGVRTVSSISVSNDICIFVLVQRTFFTMPLTKDLYRTGLHNSRNSKGQIININLPRAAKVYFTSMWRFRCCVEEILERQLLI